MKLVTIYKREVMVRTGFRKYPFNPATQIIIYYGRKKVLANCSESIDNPRLRVKFASVYNSAHSKKFADLIESTSKKRDNASKSLLNLLTILNERIEKGAL